MDINVEQKVSVKRSCTSAGGSGVSNPQRDQEMTLRPRHL